MRYSLDNGATWTETVNFTGSRRMTVSPTVPGKVYLFELCALGGSTGQSPWSNPFSIMST